MGPSYRREDLARPDALMTALRSLFPDFGDDELSQEVRSGDANLHTVMREFSSSFSAASAEPSQLTGLASLIGECIAASDDLENAVGTCFLEHLRQIDKGGLLWKRLSPEVKAYVGAH